MKIKDTCKQKSSTFVQHAFTLAEALVTVVIIGIVAAMILSPLITNYQKKQTAAQLKKLYLTLHHAIDKAQINNGDKASWTFNSDSEAREFYDNEILPHMKCEKIVPATVTSGSHCFFADGSAILVYNTRGYGLLEVYFYPSSAKKYLKGTAKGSGKRYRLYYSMDYKSKGETLQFYGNILNYTRDYLMNTGPGGFKCKGGDPRACLYIIMLDGWEIKDDYPW